MRSLLRDMKLVALAGAGWLCLLVACGGDEKKPPQAAAAPAPQPTAQAAGPHAAGEMPATMTTPPRAAPPPDQPIVVEEEVQLRCELPVEGEQAPQFDYGEAELNDEGEEILDTVATCLKQGELEGEAIRIVGHADARGSEQYNMDLAMRRAVAVREYLFERGVSPGSIVVTSEGERSASGDDDEGRALDRRVEIEIATPRATEESPEVTPEETPEGTENPY